MSVLGGLIRRSVEDPAQPLTSASLGTLLGGAPTESGMVVTPMTAMGLVAVYRSIALLAGVMGAMPWHAYRKVVAGGSEEVGSRVIAEPHRELTDFEIKEFIGQSMLTHGNAYMRKLRARSGAVVELDPLHPGRMQVERRREWIGELSPSGKRFFWTDDDGREWRWGSRDVLHIPGLSYDGVVGLSPIGLARRTIGLSMAAESFGASMFGRGALIQGVLQTDSSLANAPAGHIDRIKAQFGEKTRGANRWWDTPVLDNGLKFERIQLPPADAQFIESRRMGTGDVACLFGLPPHLLAAVDRSTSWGTGIEHQGMQMLVFTVDPWLTRVEKRVGREVIADRGVYVKFNRAALMRADTASRFMAYYRGITGGWLNADEIRALEEMDPLPDGLGQTHYHPSNVTPIRKDDTE